MRFPLLLASTNPDPENLSIFDPAGPAADHIRDLFYLVLAIAFAIALVVEGTLIYNLWRFRQKLPGDRKEPPQVYGSTPIEIAWTTAPALICFILGLLLIRTELQVREPTPLPANGDNALFVTVVGHQWWWEYRYDSYDGKKLGFVTANELHLPASDGKTARKVYLTLLSADTVHSFWLPRLGGKTDLIPNRTNQMWLQGDTPGLFLGQCGDFCGTQHANMLLRAYVDKPEDFAAWLEQQRPEAVTPPRSNPRAREGQDVFLKQSCISCHAVRGTKAQGTFGPDLTHLMSRKTLLTGMIDNNREQLRAWIDDPQSIKPGCLMPAFKLPQRDLDLVVDYLITLR